jgi:L-seryl-tRNA(Ser) seleniumtransferase
VEKVLQSLGDSELPRPVVVDVVRRHLQGLRSKKLIEGFDDVLAGVRADLERRQAGRIQPVINGTGILVHTNLGRAPLGPVALDALSAIGAGYSTLEYNPVDGTRAGRAGYLEQSLALLCGAEAATVVNNNAAALLLILRHFCRGEVADVVISRGELVQIGGGFRIPEVLEASGARLREVGTTNHTSVADYARAIGRGTALVLKVHRSNFFMDGFVESPAAEDIAAVTRRKRVPFVEDLGSGAVVETRSNGVEHEPTPAEAIRRGVNLVCFSGDKLLGGPQAGIIAGRRKHISGLKREPLFRALRCDKLILSALEATVDSYLRGEERVPVLEMLRLSDDELRRRAERIVAGGGFGRLAIRIVGSKAQVGGGTLPRSTLTSVALDLAHPSLKPQEIAAFLRARPTPLIGYVARGSVKLDIRTIFPAQDDAVIGALRALGAR